MSELNSTSTNPTPNRDRDEWVAVVVALLVLGGVGTWILGRGAIASLWRDRVPEWVSLDGGSAAPGGSLSGMDPVGQGDPAPNRSFFTLRSPEQSSEQSSEQPSEQLSEQLSEPLEQGRSAAGRSPSGTANDGNRPARPAPETTMPFFAPAGPLPAAPAPVAPGDRPPTANPNLAPPADSQPPPAQPLAPVAKPAQIVDVPADYWAAPFINALVARGVIAGFEDGTYRPDAPVTRAELAALVNQVYADLADRQPVREFQDVPADYWAAEAISRSTRIGFMSGYPGQQFRPEQSISRLEVLLTFAAGLDLRSPDLPDVLLQQTFQDSDQVAAWAQPKIAAATRAGLPANSPDPAQLEPNRPATRSEVAVMLYQALVASGRIDPLQSPYLSEP